MHITIKQYKSDDYELVKSWWSSANEIAPAANMIPDTSYVLYLSDTPILAVSLYLTNSPLAWVDNFVGNPESKGHQRKECGHVLLSHLEKIAKEEGKSRLFCMSMNEKTSKRYEEMGFQNTCSGIFTFVKDMV